MKRRGENLEARNSQVPQAILSLEDYSRWLRRNMDALKTAG